jgi:hypothetical protein
MSQLENEISEMQWELNRLYRQAACLENDIKSRQALRYVRRSSSALHLVRDCEACIEIRYNSDLGEFLGRAIQNEQTVYTWNLSMRERPAFKEDILKFHNVHSRIPWKQIQSGRSWIAHVTLSDAFWKRVQDLQRLTFSL